MSALESTTWSDNRHNDRDDIRRLLSTTIAPRLKPNSRPRSDYITDINERPASRSEKWGINDSFLFSLIGCFRPAIRKFMAARQAQIDDLNCKQGFGQGHNYTNTRMPFSNWCVLLSSRF